MNVGLLFFFPLFLDPVAEKQEGKSIIVILSLKKKNEKKTFDEHYSL